MHCHIFFIPQSSTFGKFCSTECSHAFKRGQTIKEWKNGTRKAGKWIKRYLTETRGYRCEICKNHEWNEQPIALEIEHGNSDNNHEDNLCLICPNCHAQTSTYKGRNRGRGRYKRRQRYRAGLSY